MLIIPGTVRYGIQQQYLGRPVVNVLDVFLVPAVAGTQRQPAIEFYADIVQNTWHTKVYQYLSNKAAVLGVNYVDLDSATGSTGYKTKTGSGSGASNAAPTSGQNAMLVRKNIGGARNTRSGRWYVAGLIEDQTDGVSGNNITSTALGGFQTAFNEMRQILLTPFTVTSGGVEWQPLPVVVHEPAVGDPSVTAISGFACNSLLATQRRRLRG